MANANGTESVKISSKVLQKIRKYAEKRGHTISGYINNRLNACIETDMASEIQQSNKTKK